MMTAAGSDPADLIISLLCCSEWRVRTLRRGSIREAQLTVQYPTDRTASYLETMVTRARTKIDALS